MVMRPVEAVRTNGVWNRLLMSMKVHDCLTPTETRIVRLLLEGHSYKTAAAVSDIGLNTVAFHIRNIYRKLNVNSKSEAIAKVLMEIRPFIGPELIGRYVKAKEKSEAEDRSI